MRYIDPHQQLFNTQCQGLSAVWARAALQEARDGQRGPQPVRAAAPWVTRSLLAGACSAAVLLIWLLVAPAESAASAWAGDSLPVVAKATS